MPITEEQTSVEQVYAWWQTERALRDRRDEILTSFEKKEAFPTDELLSELAEINIKLGDA